MPESTIDTKALVAGALAIDQQLVAAGKPGHVTVWDARSMSPEARIAPDLSEEPDAGDDLARIGRFVTLSLDDLPGFPGTAQELQDSVCSDTPPRYAVLVMAISADVAKVVYQAATSRIIRPNQPIIPGNGGAR